MYKTHVGGHLPFEVPLIKFDGVKKFVITVAVNNTLSSETIPPGEFSVWHSKVSNLTIAFQKPNFDYFNYAGILRSVYVIHLSENYMKNIKLISSVNNSYKFFERKKYFYFFVL